MDPGLTYEEYDIVDSFYHTLFNPITVVQDTETRNAIMFLNRNNIPYCITSEVIPEVIYKKTHYVIKHTLRFGIKFYNKHDAIFFKLGKK